MKIYSIILLILILLLNSKTYGQAPNPMHETNWIEQDSDMFNYSKESNFTHFRQTLYGGFGWSSYLWGGPWGQDGDSVYETDDNDSGHNYIFDSINGIMSLVAKKESYYGSRESKYFKYTKGVLKSSTPYKYGYYELRLRAPQPTTTGGNHSTSTGMGISFNWWTYNVQSSSPWTSSELDMAETDASYPMMTTNVHYREKAYGSTSDPDTVRDTIEYHVRLQSPYSAYGTDQFPDFSGGVFHVVSVEWAPDFVKFYMDNQLVRTSYRHCDKILPSGFIIHFFVPQTQWGTSVTSHTVFPYNLGLDYIKVWQLKMDSCNGSASVFNKIDAATYPEGVKKSIHVTGNAASHITSGQTLILRASDYIQIDKNFQVDKGADFEIIPTKCQ